VHENFAALESFGNWRAAIAARKREVAHFASGFLAPARLDQLVIGPESAVQECDVLEARFHALTGFSERHGAKQKIFRLVKAQAPTPPPKMEESGGAPC